MVCAMLQVEIFVKDEIIFREGEHGDRFYIVLSGGVEVLKKMSLPKKRQGHHSSVTMETKNKRVALLAPGTYFGELALIRSASRACTCKATSRTACAVLSKDDYQALLLQSDRKELAYKMDILRRSSLFENCSDKELTYFSYFFRVR